MLDEYLEYLNEAYLISDKTISIDLDKFIEIKVGSDGDKIDS